MKQFGHLLDLVVDHINLASIIMRKVLLHLLLMRAMMVLHKVHGHVAEGKLVAEVLQLVQPLIIKTIRHIGRVDVIRHGVHIRRRRETWIILVHFTQQLLVSFHILHHG